MRLGILSLPHQIVGQVGIKIKTSITGGKESNPLKRICLSQDGRASFVKSVQSTLSHLISTSVPPATFTRFLIQHGLFEYYS